MNHKNPIITQALNTVPRCNRAEEIALILREELDTRNFDDIEDILISLNEYHNSKKVIKKDPIIEAVRKKLLDRSQVGLDKYGVGLDRTDLNRLDWLIHAQEEALDLAGYLEVLIQKENDILAIPPTKE